MYDLPRPGKARGGSDDGSPPKCIRPLASGLLLQPGHDEIRALGDRIGSTLNHTAPISVSRLTPPTHHSILGTIRGVRRNGAEMAISPNP